VNAPARSVRRAAEAGAFSPARRIVVPELEEAFEDLLGWIRTVGLGVEVVLTPIEARVLSGGQCFAEIIPYREALQVKFGVRTRWEVRLTRRRQAPAVAHEILRAFCRERREQLLDGADR
jgi:hypothetical protein